ncbi:MAG: YggS family pyridoxal phosphate-dependent enzyme [Leptonema sp. (in: bacteria)]
MNPLKALDSIKNYISTRGYTISKLVVVTKNRSHEIIQLLYDGGHRDFGENKVQEAEKKFPLVKVKMDQPLIRHHIGPFQSGNAKKTILTFDWIQGISSLSGLKTLIQTSKKLYEKTQKKIYYLIQLNLTEEPTKLGGMTLQEFESSLELNPELFMPFPFLEWKGFMAMGPSSGDLNLTRKVFKKLREIKEQYYPNAELSMGMSHDWQIALEEGATILRIGSAIVGER